MLGVHVVKYCRHFDQNNPVAKSTHKKYVASSRRVKNYKKLLALTQHFLHVCLAFAVVWNSWLPLQNLMNHHYSLEKTILHRMGTVSLFLDLRLTRCNIHAKNIHHNFIHLTSLGVFNVLQ